MQNAQPVDLATLASIISECWGILLNVHLSVKYMFFWGGWELHVMSVAYYCNIVMQHNSVVKVQRI